MTTNKTASRRGNEAEIDAILEAIRHERRRERRDNAFLTGYAAAFDPFPTVQENHLSERAGLWADWSGLGRDLREAASALGLSRTGKAIELCRPKEPVMAKYIEIENWVRGSYGWTPKTCWIAHCKELAGLPVRRAHNRQGGSRVVPCPENKQDAIFAAFRHFNMI